ncbi:2-C-methyl-D-erythritol 2,4-cyclodiphosphate synthase [Kineobactrum sediminis]|uniref:2-C-methyl-D-erythritol 2,4-cyclodiphosphate synthase n=1 Tax=Kineobactrum sediminis TaxID=1905677 RepID=A0A2N5Y1N7_9GAMM|nr:2-C-methyl-D-erythritol 2,4-cyclodiphosphate synthase [Kineobactrum sediminis]PLW82301.1 2-C-methyl-D-erythritol 2,4-cyclodiphosphate synthase [Kineobactrum sediminis]
MRIGQGYDVHRFGDGDAIVIGGATIPYSRGLQAHSDGDVLIHALCDALLGAIGRGDIGRHFPDSDPALAGVDSRILLRAVVAQVTELGWILENMDATIVAQAPRMAPHIPLMEANLAADLETDVGRVNVKATTTEQLGFTGRGEGVAAYAVVLLSPVSQ